MNPNVQPITRLVAAILAQLLMQGLHAIGMDLGSDLVNAAADAVASIAALYLVPERLKVEHLKNDNNQE